MEYFLLEIANSCSRTNSTISTFGDCIIDNQLDYNALFSKPIVINSLCYSWLYKTVFGIYPSKLNIPTLEIETFESHINHLIKNSVAGFFKDLIKPEALRPRYEAYKQSVVGNRFVKKELFNILKDRIQSDAEYDEGITLWSLYKNMFTTISIQEYYENARVEIETNLLLSKSVFSKTFPRDIRAVPGDYDVLTVTDAVKYITGSDFFFLRQIYQQRIIICNRNVNNIITLFPSVVIEEEQHKYQHCIPKIASECITTLDCTLTLNPNNTLFINNFNGPYEAFDYYVTTRIREFWNIPRSINIPSVIQKIMFDKYEKVKYMYNVSTLPDNAVLIIDNRPNIMSVISAKNTLSNLKPGMWSIVVVTAEKHYDFYKSHFPTAILLSHVLQNKSGKFDIEDYNVMLKSPSLWRMLSDKNIKTVLLVQDDGFLVRPGMEDVFMDQTGKCKYKYVGAPWPESDMLKIAGATSMIGNGGLSLRDVPAMLKITENSTESETNALFNMNFQPLPEDVFFSMQLSKDTQGLPSKELGNMFASEMTLNKKSFGIHKPWGYFQISEIISMFFT